MDKLAKTGMRILRLKSRLLRATSTTGLCVALASTPVVAQLRPGAAERAEQLNQQAGQPAAGNEAAVNSANPAASVAPTQAPPRIIQHIVVRGTQRWAMDRQVRMTAGSLVLLGFIGSKLASPKLGYLSAGIGAGLVYSAASNSCAMASVLSKMPWNKASTNGKANPLAQIPNAGQQLNPHGK